MSTKFTSKFWIAGFILASVIALGTIYVFAQEGPNTAVTFSEEDELTLTGTISSIDDHGFVMVSGSETYYVVIPYIFDRSVLDLNIGSEVTLIGYIVESPMMDFSSYPTIHSISINGIVIDYVPQMQSRDGSCGGNGGMGGNGRMGGNGPNYGGNRG